MKTVLFILCLSGLSCQLIGQDAKADFRKINEVYNNTMTFGMDITYELFLDGAKQPYQTETGKYIRSQKKYYTKQGYSEVIITDDLMFMIDKESKVVAVDHKIADDKIVSPLSQSLDSLFTMYSKTEYIPANSSGMKGYRFFMDEGPYSLCEVYFDQKTNFVKEIRQVFRDKIMDEQEKPRLAVLKTTFYNITTKQALSIFDNTNYIRKINQKIVLAEPYKSYTFINHLN